jgi:hypothetical protein
MHKAFRAIRPGFLFVCTFAVACSMATLVSTSDSKRAPGGRFAISRTSCGQVSGVACADVSEATPWSDADLGHQRVRGLSTEADGALIVTGGGTGIGDTLDQFHFTYQRVTGDVDIVARLLAVDGDHPLALAGLMIRAALQPTAAHASLLGEVSRPVSFKRRLSDGWTSIATKTAFPSVGSWLKLERRGQLISAYVSNDGANWAFIGADLVELSDEAFVGFAVASHQPNDLATSIFDSVSLVTVGDGSAQTDPPPIADAPSVTDPPVVATDPAPPAVVVPDPIAQSPPPSTSVVPPPAESTAPPTEILQPAPPVSPEPATPRYLVFEPSPDHDVDVTGYTFEVWRADATVEVMVHDLGKPSVNSGECQVDVSDWLRQLPAGSYMGVVKAVNEYGASAGASSAPFAIQ